MKVLVLTNMYPSQKKPSLGTFVWDQVKSLREEGVCIDVLVIDGWKNKLNYFWGIFRLWFRLLIRRYDLIHAHYIFCGIIARVQFLYPVVLTHHGLEAFTGWQGFLSRMFTRFMDKIIFVSREQKEKLPYKNADIIPCGVDLSLFKPIPREEARKKLDIESSDKKLVLVLWARELTRPEKRLDIVQSALKLVNERDPTVELIVITDKPHSMIPLYMNACDVLLLVSDAEGSPVVIKEAMACNLPIVSTSVGDVADVIGGTDGCYLCSQDPSDVAEKLGLALSHPGRTMGRDAIKSLEQGNIAKKIVTLYQEVYDNKTRKSGNNNHRGKG